MKTIKTPDPFHTESWCLEATTNPQRVFFLCFEHAGDIDAFRKMLLHVMLFIEQFEPQKEIPVYRVCCAFMALHSVIAAAHYIYRQGAPHPGGEEQTGFASYFISAAEHANLHEVLKTFFSYQTRQEWMANMHLVLYHCLTDRAIGVEMDLFSHWFYLTKLLEAAWLMAAR
ncbi:hypothetical protein [Niabella aurantiaca]|uniref:hypothetical protein n=1 Tax=Niabella aurantiaca TaxID=379900 RepID=UPI0003701826|nr:hypothetical protein [Niabella aurantiaca]